MVSVWLKWRFSIFYQVVPMCKIQHRKVGMKIGEAMSMNDSCIQTHILIVMTTAIIIIMSSISMKEDMKIITWSSTLSTPQKSNMVLKHHVSKWYNSFSIKQSKHTLVDKNDNWMLMDMKHTRTSHMSKPISLISYIILHNSEFCQRVLLLRKNGIKASAHMRHLQLSTKSAHWRIFSHVITSSVGSMPSNSS